MTHFDQSISRSTGNQTTSFGVHRNADRPASAIRAGASTMPQAWQTRGSTKAQGHTGPGAPVRSFADIALDPLRWVVASKWNSLATVAAIGLAVALLWG